MASTLDYLRTEKRDAILALARKHGISLVSEAIHRSGSHAAMTKHFFAHVIYILESDEFWDGETGGWGWKEEEWVCDVDNGV